MLPRLITWPKLARLISSFPCPPLARRDSPVAHPVARLRFPAIVCCVVALLVAGGCGGGIDPSVGKVVLVSGRVLVNGEPLQGKKGVVTFVPNETKGNVAPIQPTGDLDESGNYTLYYAKSKKGAPLGWYKVQVSAAKLGPGTKMGPELKDPKKMTGAPFNAKFTNVKTSGLEVEVVESPAAGAYDLKLTK